MEIAFTICVTIIILAIVALLYSINNDKHESTIEEKPIELTNETKTLLQFEKAKAEIEALHQKANLFKSISNLLNFILILSITIIIIIFILFLAGLAGCATIASNIKF